MDMFGDRFPIHDLIMPICPTIQFPFLPYPKRLNESEKEVAQEIQNTPYAPVYLNDGDNWYILEGKPLQDFITPEYRLTPLSCTVCFSQVVYFLHDLAEKGIFYNDIKPDNIICYEGAFKLIDFGSALKEKEKDGEFKKTTELYKAPEKYTENYESDNKWNEKCDIYSLGLTMFNIETGITPYECEESSEKKKKYGIPLPYPDVVSDDTKYFINFMTHVNPDDRPSLNLLNVIVYQNAYLSSLVQPSWVPPYFSRKDQIKEKFEESNKEFVMKCDWIIQFCKDIFENSQNKYTTAKEIRKMLTAKIKENKEAMKTEENEEEKRRRKCNIELIDEIKKFLSKEPTVASLFYNQCYQKTNTGMYTIFPYDPFLGSKYFVKNGKIALEFNDYLKDSFKHFQRGNRKGINPNVLSDNLDFSEESKDEVKMMFDIGVKYNKAQDYTDFFVRAIKNSPMTDDFEANYDEDIIDNFYIDQYNDENKINLSTGSLYKCSLDECRYPELYCLFPTLLFFPADHYQTISPDPIDMIYYTNIMLTKAHQDCHGHNYLIYRLLFMMRELNNDLHIKKDLALASEFAELVPDKVFKIDNIFIAEHLIILMENIKYSLGAAYDKHKFCKNLRLLNIEGLATPMSKWSPQIREDYDDDEKYIRCEWLNETIHEIMCSRREESLYYLTFNYDDCIV